MKTPNEENGGIKPHIVEVGLIDFDPLNRKDHDKAKLESLRDTIKAEGLLEPLVVRPHPTKAGRYMLIAGERRLRAIQMLKWAKVDVRLVDNKDDAGAAKKRLVENMQREDLTPIEEARGYRELVVDHKLTQKEIAELAGVGQPTVANSLRLLELPKEAQQMVQDGKLSRAHGVALARFIRWPKLLLAIADVAAKRGASSKELEDGVPFNYSPEVSRHIVRHVGYSGRKNLPAQFREDPDFIEESCGYVHCVAPEKWQKYAAAKKAADEAAVAKKVGGKGQSAAAIAKQQAAAVAAHRATLARNKKRREEIRATRDAALQRLAKMPAPGATELAVLASEAVGGGYHGNRLREVAEALGLKVPAGVIGSHQGLSFKPTLKMKAADIFKLAVGVILHKQADLACQRGYTPRALEAYRKGGAK